MQPIISVHLRWYKQCEEYIPFCLRQTAISNPNSECILLTTSNDLDSYFRSNVKIPENARIQVLDSEQVDKRLNELDGIFYHDQINPKWFDLFSIARHLIVSDYIKTNETIAETQSFITTDSDIAHFYDYSKQLGKVSAGEVLTGRPLMSYFATWNREAFEKYTNLTLMKEYFDYARNQPRCSDMHLLAWHIKEKKSINFTNPIFEDFGIPLDTLRKFIYVSGLWIKDSMDGNKIDELLVDYPGGDWKDPKYLNEYKCSQFWDSILTKTIQNNHLKLGLRKEILLAHMARLNKVRKTVSNQESQFFSEKYFRGKSGMREWDQVLSRSKNSIINVPYIHFQGPTKSLVNFFKSYLASV